MAIGSGLAGSVGVAPETAYGTYVAPTTFWEIGEESYDKVKNTVQGGGIAAGRFAQAGSRRVVTTEGATGGHPMEVVNKGFGAWLRTIFGSTAVPVKQGATAAYLQTHALGDNIGLSQTIQIGVPDRTGVVRPKTIKGAKVTSAEFSCGVNELLMCTLEIDGQRYSEVESLAAPSYPAGVQAFHFMQMALKLGTFGSEAVAAGVKKVTLKIERPQSTEDFYAGATIPGLKDEPIMNDWVKVSGTIETDYKDKTAFADRYHTDTPTSLVWQFTGPVIAGAFASTFELDVPMVFFDGDTPNINGNGVVSASFPFVGQLDLTNPLVSAKYMSTDTAIV